LRLKRRLVDLNSVVETICEDHRPVFTAAGIALSVHLTKAPLMQSIDVDRMEQVITNLLGNSLKFTDRGGMVTVALFVDGIGRCAVVSVRDTGIGIEASQLEAIMTSAAHDSSCRNSSGLGLGLPLARRLVELHGGMLVAASDGLGKGSEFRVLLPRALPEQSAD
jgi:signal transduction histidine kinase